MSTFIEILIVIMIAIAMLYFEFSIRNLHRENRVMYKKLSDQIYTLKKQNYKLTEVVRDLNDNAKFGCQFDSAKFTTLLTKGEDKNETSCH